MSGGPLVGLQNGYVASAGAAFQEGMDFYYIKIWDPNTGSNIAFINYESYVYSLTVIQNGFASFNAMGQVSFWDNYGGLVRTLTGISMFAELINGDLACFNSDRTMKILSKDDGTIIKTLSRFNNEVYSLVALQNGYLACGCYQKIKIWDIDQDNLVTSFSAHPADVSLLAALKDGNLASCDQSENIIKIWNPDNGFLFTTLTGETSIAIITVLNNGYLASLDGRNGVKIWNTDDGSMIKNLITVDNYGSFTGLKNGFLATSGANSIQIWNLFLD